MCRVACHSSPAPVSAAAWFGALTVIRQSPHHALRVSAARRRVDCQLDSRRRRALIYALGLRRAAGFLFQPPGGRCTHTAVVAPLLDVGRLKIGIVIGHRHFWHRPWLFQALKRSRLSQWTAVQPLIRKRDRIVGVGRGAISANRSPQRWVNAEWVTTHHSPH